VNLHVTINVVNCNTAPLVSLHASEVAYVEDGIAVPIFDQIAVSDAENDMLTASVTMQSTSAGNRLVSNNDVVATSSDTEVTVSSLSAANMITALSSIKYMTTSNSPAEETRSAIVTVSDPSGASASATVTIPVTSSNDKPTLSIPTGTKYNSDPNA